MFLVKNKRTGKVHVVFSIDRERVKSISTWDITEFLIYKNGEFQWEDSSLFDLVE